MSEPLYTLDILRLAAATGEFPRLPMPGASAERRAQTCGSRVVVDLTFDADGRVAAFGQDVSACALGQAAATLCARHVVGKTAAELADARDALVTWLTDSAASAPDWPGIDALERARAYPARHGAMRLPFEAVAEAASRAPA